MPEYRSTERVERDGYLVYAEGDVIPEDDTETLAAQGHVKAKARTAGDDKARTAGKNK